MSTSAAKLSEGLRNRVPVIIRRYTDHMEKIYRPYGVLLLLSCSFGTIAFHCVYGCMFCMLLFNFVYYVFLSLFLCILIVMYVPF